MYVNNLCAVIVQAELVMMLPGHTHEDIDAMFRFIADSLRRKGLVRTIEDIEDAARKAFAGQEVHVEHVATVFAYDKWLRPFLGTMGQITSARYFNIGIRENDNTSLPVMWYKPHAGHAHLYPTKKDPISKTPMFEVVNGEKLYITDMAGIEIFADTPTGTPGIQEFETERMDTGKVHANIKKMIAALPLLFGDDAKAWWEMWAATVPHSPDEAMRAFPMTFDWPEKCAHWKAPTMDGLRSEYTETMTYLNTQGHQAFNRKDAERAVAEERAIRPALSAGDMVVVKPGSDGGMHKLPFWIAEVAQDTPCEVDTIEVLWRTPFKGGYAKDDIEGQWLHVCKGSVLGRAGITRYHAYTPKCRIGNKDKKDHGAMRDQVQRDQVALYFAELTKRQWRM